MSIKNGDMPNIVKFINSEHDSIEFTECSGDILVAIDNQINPREYNYIICPKK